mmetsp:Transcript_53570/g.96121  ORF Transcript_53570/g.96121 Transcript_53570/m.96121 type:complete len:326 (-) Transcript_53570:1100-2077(-)
MLHDAKGVQEGTQYPSRKLEHKFLAAFLWVWLCSRQICQPVDKVKGNSRWISTFTQSALFELREESPRWRLCLDKPAHVVLQFALRETNQFLQWLREASEGRQRKWVKLEHITKGYVMVVDGITGLVSTERGMLRFYTRQQGSHLHDVVDRCQYQHGQGSIFIMAFNVILKQACMPQKIFDLVPVNLRKKSPSFLSFLLRSARPHGSNRQWLPFFVYSEAERLSSSEFPPHDPKDGKQSTHRPLVLFDCASATASRPFLANGGVEQQFWKSSHAVIVEIFQIVLSIQDPCRSFPCTCPVCLPISHQIREDKLVFTTSVVLSQRQE